LAEELQFWVAFNHVNGIGAVRFRQLLQKFGTLEKAWSASSIELRLIGIQEKSIQFFEKFRDQTDPEKLFQSIIGKGISVISWNDENYPSLLKQISAPPPILYYKGILPDPQAKYIAVVGTRRMTSYGREMAREISSFLAAHQVVIVSGLARGIDGIAHQAALDVGGCTVAVLGCGVDKIYPPEHRIMAEKITANGAILSDYPPGTPPDRINFPPRNRIISGMAGGCIIVEAGEKSGSLITARFAAEQGREVFVIPGNFNAPQSQGSNRLIRDVARPLCDKEELLEFIQSWHCSNPVSMIKPVQMSFEDPQEREILSLIELEALHIDEISRKTALQPGRIASIMMMLELKGFVIEVAPQTYQKNHSIF